MNAERIAHRFVELVTNTWATSVLEVTESENEVAEKLWDFLQCLLGHGDAANIPSDIAASDTCPSTSTDVQEFKPAASLRSETNRTNEDDSSSDYKAEEEKEKERASPHSWTKAELTKVSKFLDEHKNCSLKVVRNRFKRIKNHKVLSRVRRMIRNNGATSEKMAVVNAAVVPMFKDCRLQMLPVHDMDLQKWALQKAKEVSYSQFKASRKWLLKFKRQNGIRSRKVTMTFSSTKLQKTDAIEASANAFRIEFKQELFNYPLDQIFNSDQSGYGYEFYSNRTLSQKGEKDTALKVNSQNKISHS